MIGVRRALNRFALFTAIAFQPGCAGPIVETQVHEVAPSALRKVAVAPFQAGPRLRAGSAPPAPAAPIAPVAPTSPTPAESAVTPLPALPAPTSPTAPTGAVASDAASASASDASALTTRFVTEAFAAQGFAMIAASDVRNAFASVGTPLPHGNAEAIARAVARDLGASAVLLGSVSRYREREGSEIGATRAASVAFDLAVYAAPSGRLLWKARFDHTQVALTENLLRARSYPGLGSKWLSAAELVRWGASAAARDLAEQR